MQKAFIETRNFTARLAEFLDDDAYVALQHELLDNPNKGDVMPGCGGLRKLRVADRQRKKGRRGGTRVIYIHVPVANWILFLDIYGKNEQDDLGANEKRLLRRLAADFRKEAMTAVIRMRKQVGDEK